MGKFTLSTQHGNSSGMGGQDIGAIFSSSLIKDAGIPWFCRLRWIVVALFLFLWALGLNRIVSDFLSIDVGAWPLFCSLVLIASNSIFYWHFKFKRNSLTHVRLNIMAQIFSDILVLTVVVYFIGSTSTFVSFAYLFHIVLACIFFSRGTSLAVVCFSALLYSFCVIAEYSGILEQRQIFVSNSIPLHRIAFINTASAVFHWFVIWYLVDHLASLVKRLDMKLSQAHHNLALSQKEKLWHMQTMAHQLKNPISAIYSQAQLLVDGLCGELPDKAVQTAKKIANRCLSVSGEIKDMLQLATISYKQDPADLSETSLSRTVMNCISQLSPICEKRRIRITANTEDDIAVRIPDEHLALLVSNIITNAVIYSQDESEVIVNCFYDVLGAPVLKVQDFGIGIQEEKLPHIFEQYFRTSEAKRHNQNSSGLGLAIVKEIADRYDIRINVESYVGQGTTFTVEYSKCKSTRGTFE